MDYSMQLHWSDSTPRCTVGGWNFLVFQRQDRTLIFTGTAGSDEHECSHYEAKKYGKAIFMELLSVLTSIGSGKVPKLWAAFNSAWAKDYGRVKVPICLRGS